MSHPTYDVILIGYGPVGQALALMLGRQGRSVAVCERWMERYPLPRAVCIDHEIYRVLSANGMGAVLPDVSHPGPKYQWFNAAWEELLVVDWKAESISGGSEVNFVHQPTLEKAMSEMVARQPTVDLLLGWEVIEIQQNSDEAHVTLRDQSGTTRQISGRFLVGCDGANSIVRQQIGGGQEDRGFEANWLVVDVLLRDGVTIETLGIPPAGQYCDPLRPTTIVPAGVREGKTFRRWEFMLLPGEVPADMEEEARVWDLLKAWATPQDVELVRYKVYSFRSLLANKWRDRRFLLAGDAAHVMPPFMGQGMCSGIRDAWNLAWKLGMVLDHQAAIGLLDTYQEERLPHVSQIIDLSIYMGKVICIPDQALAAERDHAFRTGTAPPPPPFPHLAGGILHRTPAGEISPGAGLLVPHGTVSMEGKTGRFDDIIGFGFVLLTTGPSAFESLPEDLQSSLDAVGLRHYAIDSQASSRPDSFVDVDHRYGPFMQNHAWSAMIVRPDFYLYGGAGAEADVRTLLIDFMADIHQAGISRLGIIAPATALQRNAEAA